MTDFVMGLLTHLAAAVAGWMIARNPDKVLAGFAAARAWVAAKLKPAEPPKVG